MSESPAPIAPPANRDSGFAFLRSLLFVAGAMALAGGFVASCILMYEASQAGGVALGSQMVRILAPAVLGILMAAALMGISAMVTLLAALLTRAGGAVNPGDTQTNDVRPALDRLEHSLRVLNGIQSRDAAPGVGGGAASNNGSAGSGANANLGGLLEQIRDYALMDEEQRKRFAHRHWLRRRELVTELIERDVLVGDWSTAFARLDDLLLLLPDDVQVLELRERVIYEQNARLEEDMRVARARVRQFISAANFAQAEELASLLRRKYAGKSEPEALTADIRREREAYERENMERLFREIAHATEKRQWRSAILALEEFVRCYPADPRAEKLRLDLPTMLENAAAQERKESEESFKDLLKRQRYDEAIIVARAIIQKYPHSPTATELNKLLPRVEEMARTAQPAAAGA